MTQKILVLGATGRLGSEILYQLSALNSVEITATARNKGVVQKFSIFQKIKLHELDVLDFLTSPNSYNFNDFDVVINAIGAIKQKNITTSKMYLINSEFPRIMAQSCLKSKTRLIHFSTDCVFRGEINKLKTETTPHDAIDDYGKSKSLGEVSQDNFWNLRASFIGNEVNTNHSLLNWFLSQKIGSAINGFANQFWNGITSYHYGMIIRKMIEYSFFPESRMLHLIPENDISKYELLKKLQYNFNREDIVVNRYTGSEEIYRQIQTEFPEQNLELWSLIGRMRPPKIEQLIEELALEYSSRKYLYGTN